MKRNNWRKLTTLIGGLIFFLTISAQTKYEGDQLITFLGKAPDSWEFTNLKNGYAFDMANDAHYLSSEGIELILTNGVLHEIQLYRNSAVYGSFKGALPRGLRFGMNAAEVRKILGKPTVIYNSTGYLEFEWNNNYVYSCSFENGQLSQVTVGLK
jgi:hypothetical protein